AGRALGVDDIALACAAMGDRRDDRRAARAFGIPYHLFRPHVGLARLKGLVPWQAPGNDDDGRLVMERAWTRWETPCGPVEQQDRTNAATLSARAGASVSPARTLLDAAARRARLVRSDLHPSCFLGAARLG